jgi:hypothetical protein
MPSRPANVVARQRRLLRAAYLLADSDQRLEASIMLRAMPNPGAA